MSIRPDEAASALAQARLDRRPRTPFTADDASLDEDWGYAVQDIDKVRRMLAGERFVGLKLGLTSAAKQQRMKVHRPVIGFLTDAMVTTTGELPGRLDTWIQPRAEPEIAFRLTAELRSPVDRATAVDLVDRLCLAVEIIDSRYQDYRFDLADVVADNTSAAGVLFHPEQYLLGEIGPLSTLECRVEKNGAVVHRGTGSDVLGDPLRAVVALSEHLASRSERLPAGSWILTGALTDAVPLTGGSSYSFEIGGLGSLEFTL